MPTFAYSGKTRGGQMVSGERMAETADAAVAALRRDQILVTRINPAKAARAEGAAAKRAGQTNKRVKTKNLAVFVRQFSVMIDAGLPLVQCLDILGGQEEDVNFAAVIGQTRKDVESGASLADAMPMTVLEAMAIGTPIVASEVGDIPVREAGTSLALVFAEIELADGSGAVPVQLMWSNQDDGPARRMD